MGILLMIKEAFKSNQSIDFDPASTFSVMQRRRLAEDNDLILNRTHTQLSSSVSR